jgi:hypothetical protein
MIGLAANDAEGSVELFEQDETREAVGQGQPPE